MNASQWERAKEIFDSALDLPSDSRPEFLLHACEGDAAILAEVQELLNAAADADSSSFLDNGWLQTALSPQPDFALQPGDVVCDRFQIIRPLGDGGMGRVYEAYDGELGGEVALKTLRPEIANNPEVLKRFRQEVRIAHRITHPNVCRTFHLDHEIRSAGPDDPQPFKLVFLTMEYLDGETLQQILKREGRVALPRTLAIARQMAEAIEAAHHIGVVHRDIKPGNVMICAAASAEDIDARVVVTDFGLAKFGAGAGNSDLSSISHVGRPMGTLAYMSPEQLEAGEASPATDIYAFGLVLFEMVTGHKAFPDSSTLQAAFRRITEPPPSPRLLVPDLPPEWEAAILGCLQIDPADRFQHACDVIDVLEGASPSPSRTHSSRRIRPLAKSASPPQRRKIFALAAVLAISVALLWIGFRFFTTRGDAAVAPGTLVYLAPVKNETGEKQLDNVTELVRAGLEQSAHINLLDTGRVGDTLQRMTKPADTPITPAIAREIAMRVAAPRVIFATLTKPSGIYHLDVDIQQPDNSPVRARRHWHNTFTWQAVPATYSSGDMPEALLASIRTASNWIRQNVGESSNDIARLDAPPEDVTTSNWAALTDFTFAEKLSLEHKREEAVVALRSATAKDPQFALAYARLGDVLVNIGRRSEGYVAYRQAMDAKAVERLSLRERDRIKGICAQDTGDFQTSETAFREYSVYYEHDYTGWFYRALPLVMLGHTTDAIDALKHAHEAAPDRMGAIGLLARYSMLKGDYDEARHWIDDLKARHEDDEVLTLQGSLFFLESNYTASVDAFSKLSRSKVPVFRAAGFAGVAEVLAEQGKTREAVDILSRAIDAVPEDNLLLLNRGDIYCRLTEYSLALADFDRAIKTDSSPGSLLTISRSLGGAVASARGTEKSRLRNYLASLSKLLPQSALETDAALAAASIRGETFLAEGKVKEAFAEFQKADALEAPLRPRDYMARALLAMAAHEPNAMETQNLRQKAADAYAGAALHPGILWYSPRSFPPGFYADQLQAWLRLSQQTNQPQTEIAAATNRLAALRQANPKLSR